MTYAQKTCEYDRRADIRQKIETYHDQSQQKTAMQHPYLKTH